MCLTDIIMIFMYEVGTTCEFRVRNQEAPKACQLSWCLYRVSK